MTKRKLSIRYFIGLTFKATESLLRAPLQLSIRFLSTLRFRLPSGSGLACANLFALFCRGLGTISYLNLKEYILLQGGNHVFGFGMASVLNDLLFCPHIWIRGVLSRNFEVRNASSIRECRPHRFKSAAHSSHPIHAEVHGSLLRFSGFGSGGFFSLSWPSEEWKCDGAQNKYSVDHDLGFQFISHAEIVAYDALQSCKVIVKSS